MAKFKKLFGGSSSGKHTASRVASGDTIVYDDPQEYFADDPDLYDDVENTIEPPAPPVIPDMPISEDDEENSDFDPDWEQFVKVRQTRNRIIGILAGIILVGLVVGFIGLGIHAKGLNTVYPNVTMSGIQLGGLTYDEAVDALTKAGYDNMDGTAVVEIYYKSALIRTIYITSEEANVKMDVGDAAKTALNYGHGNIFTSAVNYLNCVFEHHNLGISDVQFDRKKVRELITKGTSDLAVSYLANSYEIQETGLKVTKGIAQRSIDENAIYLLFFDIFSTADFQRAKYEVDVREPNPIDFEAISKKVFVEGKNATINAETGEIDPEVTGVSLNVPIAQYTYDSAEKGSTFMIPFTIIEPTVTAATLEKKAFVDTLASKSTELTSSSNRNTNITLAAKAIDGLIMNPGDTFSFNDVVGQRTEAKGYKEAGAYVGGQTVNEVGGGICQVSSTLYYCTLIANLKTVDRECHMFPVAYLPLGMDATVSWGGPDFKFTNNSDYPIKLVAYVEGSDLHVEILGTKANDHTFSMTYETVRTINYKTTETVTSSVSSRTVETSGITGYVVDTYRTEYDGSGNAIRTSKIARSEYQSRDEVVLVPPASTSNEGGGNNSGENETGNSGGNNGGETGGNNGGGSSGGSGGGTTETTPPVDDPTPPVDDPTPPVDDPTPPVDDPTPPVDDPTPPVDDPTPPVDDPTPPVDDPTPPVDDPTPPVDDPTPPDETGEDLH